MDKIPEDVVVTEIFARDLNALSPSPTAYNDPDSIYGDIACAVGCENTLSNRHYVYQLWLKRRRQGNWLSGSYEPGISSDMATSGPRYGSIGSKHGAHGPRRTRRSTELGSTAVEMGGVGVRTRHKANNAASIQLAKPRNAAVKASKQQPLDAGSEALGSLPQLIPLSQSLVVSSDSDISVKPGFGAISKQTPKQSYNLAQSPVEHKDEDNSSKRITRSSDSGSDSREKQRSGREIKKTIRYSPSRDAGISTDEGTSPVVFELARKPSASPVRRRIFGSRFGSRFHWRTSGRVFSVQDEGHGSSRGGRGQRSSRVAKNDSKTGGKVSEAGNTVSEIQSSTAVVGRREKTTKWKIGDRLEARDFLNKWYPARVMDIDEVQNLMLIHFEGWNQRFDDWLEADGDRIRAVTEPSLDIAAPKYTTRKVGENVMAKWTDGFMYPGSVMDITKTGSYLIHFYDGLKKVVHPSNIESMPADVKAACASRGITLNVAATSSKSHRGRPKLVESVASEVAEIENLKQDGTPETASESIQIASSEELSARQTTEISVTSGELDANLVTFGECSVDQTAKISSSGECSVKQNTLLVVSSECAIKEVKEFLPSDYYAVKPAIPLFPSAESTMKQVEKSVTSGECSVNPVRKLLQSGERSVIEPDLTKACVVSLDCCPAAEELSKVKQSMSSRAGRKRFGRFRNIGPSTFSLRRKSLMTAQPIRGQKIESGGGAPGLEAESMFRCTMEGCDKSFRKELLLNCHIKYYHNNAATSARSARLMHQLTGARLGQRGRTSAMPQDTTWSDGAVCPTAGKRRRRTMTEESMTESLEQSSEQNVYGAPATRRLVNCSCGVNRAIAPCLQCTVCLCWQHIRCIPSRAPVAKSTTEIETVASTTTVKKPVAEETTAANVTTSVEKQPTNVPGKATNEQPAVGEFNAETITTTTENLSKSMTETVTQTSTSTEQSKMDDKVVAENIKTIFDGKIAIISTEDVEKAMTELENVQTTTEVKYQPKGEDDSVVESNARSLAVIKATTATEEKPPTMAEFFVESKAAGMMYIDDDDKEDYVCFICRNPPGVRRSRRYAYDQSFLRQGRLRRFSFVPDDPGEKRDRSIIRSTYDLVADMHNVRKVISATARKIFILRNRKEPELSMWKSCSASKTLTTSGYSVPCVAAATPVSQLAAVNEYAAVLAADCQAEENAMADNAVVEKAAEKSATDTVIEAEKAFSDIVTINRAVEDLFEVTLDKAVAGKATGNATTEKEAYEDTESCLLKDVAQDQDEVERRLMLIEQQIEELERLEIDEELAYKSATDSRIFERELEVKQNLHQLISNLTNISHILSTNS